jgi:hypothetical protein
LGGDNCTGLTEEDVIRIIGNQLKTIEQQLIEISQKVDRVAEPIVEVNKYEELPAAGAPKLLYVVKNENASYRWDDVNLQYYCIGRDYGEIQVLYGGSATH